MAERVLTDPEALGAAAATPRAASATRSVRLCVLVDPRPYAKSLGLSPADEIALYSLHGFAREPNDDEVIDAHVDYVFRRSLIGRNDRYTSDTGALYTSLEATTAEAEMRYYCREVFFDGKSLGNSYTFSDVCIEFKGRLRDITDICRRHPKLRLGTDVSFCQKVGKAALADVDAILVGSVRARGTNQATVSPTTLSSGGFRGQVTIDVHVRKSGRYTRLRRH